MPTHTRTHANASVSALLESAREKRKTRRGQTGSQQEGRKLDPHRRERHDGLSRSESTHLSFIVFDPSRCACAHRERKGEREASANAHSDAMRGTRGCGGWRRGTRTMDAASGERAGRERGRESARERAARARMEDGRGRTFNKGECGRGLTLTADFTAKTRERWRSLASRSVEDSRRGRRRRCCAARCVALLRSRGRV